MIPKFRCFVRNKRMFEVEAIDFAEKEVQVPVYDKDTGEYLASTIVNFDDIILMQSTGLFDSQLKPVEIYKDDIVKRTSLIPGGSDLIGLVKMLEGCWVIDDGKQAVPLWTEVDENIVLGNIHENLEWVEGRDEMD